MRRSVLFFIILLSFTVTGLIGCGGNSDEVTKKDGGGPLVLNSIPKNGASNVPTTAEIVVIFDKDIAPPSIANLTFTPSVGGNVSYDSTTHTIVFKPSAALSKNTKYSMTVKGITDTGGNAISPITISFMTSEPDTTPPEIISTSPENNQEDVGHDSKILIKFSEPVDRSKLLSGIAFEPTADISSDKWVLEWAVGENEEVTISPPHDTTPFEVDTEYAMSLLKNNVVDLSGNAMKADYKFKFHTLRYSVENVKNLNISNVNMAPQWMYTVGKSGSNWVIIWGGPPPAGAPSQAKPNGTITASADGRIAEKVDTLNSRGGDEFKPSVTSGNGNSVSFQTADLDNQKKFRIILTSTSSYLTFDLRSSAGTLASQYVFIGDDLVNPSRTPFTLKNK
jgi:hypothetical protein